jgi:UDP-2,3-diacylglucosamine pyrophosphatase LpxH
LAKGKFIDGETRKFPVPVYIHLIPGNHDRLVNSTLAIRREVRKSLGMGNGGDHFPHVLAFPNEGAIIRHGHEYDKYNFSTDISRYPSIPLHLPDDSYDESPFGDFATIDIASQIPYLFRQHHGDDQILADPILRQVYVRLLEFDDLRPQQAILNYLLNIPSKNIDQIAVWKAIEPIINTVLENIHENPFLSYWLDRMDKKWRLDAIDIVQTALSLKSWRISGIPLGFAKFTSNTLLGTDIIVGDVVSMAAKEEVIQRGEYQYIVAGHTHRPATELIASDELGERYYIDTGTWRNRVPATSDFKAFGRLKSMTYVIIYGPDEDPGNGSDQAKITSVDFWSGITQRWNE